MIAPIYDEVAKKLEAFIRGNHFEGRLPGQGPLSRQFGVNPHTIGKALHVLEDKGLVTINGTKGVFVNRKLHERPVYKVIGLVGLTNTEERDHILEQLEPYVQRFGYHLLGIVGTTKLFSEKQNLLSSFPVDGLLFCYSSLTYACANDLRAEQLPIVACNQRWDIPWLNTVDFHHEAHFKKVITLLRRHGHRSIGLLAPKFEAENRQAYNAWLKDVYRTCLGKEWHPDLYYSLERRMPDTGSSPCHAADMEILQALRHFFSLRQQPTALIVPSQWIDLVRRMLARLEISVPQDLSLVAWGPACDDEVSQIKLDYLKLWQQAFQRLLRLMDHRQEASQELLLTMPWHEGKTVAKARAGEMKESWGLLPWTCEAQPDDRLACSSPAWGEVHGVQVGASVSAQ